MVLTGADLPRLQGAAPGRCWPSTTSTTAWKQVPVQVDERAVLDLAKPKNAAPVGHTFLYTDPNTFTGPTPTPPSTPTTKWRSWASTRASSCRPAPRRRRGRRLRRGGEDRGLAGRAEPVYLYLFRQTGNLDPAAGKRYVNYTFNLLSGDYKTTYRLGAGPNPRTRRSPPTSTRTTSPIAGRTTPCGSPRRSRAAWTSSTATRTCSRRATACADCTPAAPGR